MKLDRRRKRCRVSRCLRTLRLRRRPLIPYPDGLIHHLPTPQEALHLQGHPPRADELSAFEARLRSSSSNVIFAWRVPNHLGVPRLGYLKRFVSTDLLFLIDTTSSMYGHINAAKEQVKSIMSSIEAAFLYEAQARIAVVGHKDHSDKG